MSNEIRNGTSRAEELLETEIESEEIQPAAWTAARNVRSLPFPLKFISSTLLPPLQAY